MRKVMTAIACGIFCIAAACLVATRGKAEAGSIFDKGNPRIYKGEYLRAVAMPIGGIGTGSIWLNGEGRLATWQIFNNLSEVSLPDSFFAIRVKQGGNEPQLRALQTSSTAGFGAMKELTYRGEYPIAWLDFIDPDLPVKVRLEAFNPMIPLDTKSSAIPCAIFRITARNSSETACEVSLAAMLQNFVGYDGYSVVHGRRFPGYGGNRITFDKDEKQSLLYMSVPSHNGPKFAKPVRLLLAAPHDRTIFAYENLTCFTDLRRINLKEISAVWVDGLSEGTNPKLLEAISHIAKSGGAVLATNVQPSFFNLVGGKRKELSGEAPEEKPIVFEDFEKGSYEGWTVEGTAFGKKPHTGTTPGQQVVSGFLGKGLVNTFLPNDGPQGVMTSRPFTIDRRYIGFLVGGGKHRGKTCINLKIGGKVARTQTGKNNELLTLAVWNVEQFKGKEAVLEIVDKHSGGWGHINIDHIIFSDQHPSYYAELKTPLEGIARAFELPFGAASRGSVSLRREESAGGETVVFEDFEGVSYKGWTVKGTAFGEKPHTGTSAHQQEVSGFIGKGLVNTFLPNDEPRGRLTSRPFIINKPFIGFLIGGGNNPGRTCMNLKVHNEVIRTQTGKGNELLEPAVWEVKDFMGEEAVIEIVDDASESWDHINVDHIIFCDRNPTLTIDEKAEILKYRGDERWSVGGYTRLEDCKPDEAGYRAAARTVDGAPLILEGPFGKGRMTLCTAGDLPRQWGMSMIAAMLKTIFNRGDGIATTSPHFGDMTLATLDTEATALPSWKKSEELAANLLDDGRFNGVTDSGISKLNETFNGALAVPFTLEPGKERTVTFIISWYFPNRETWGHKGNMYNNWFNSSREVSQHVAENFDYLLKSTHLYHDSCYESNLPYWFIDAFTSQSVIFRSQTCFWSQDGYFGGFEGSYGCCPLNCTHVWNYAQTHARLFPAIGRNMRESDLLRYMHPDGETSHRQHTPHGAFMDGQAAAIEATYREHLMSADTRFLDKVWPNCKKAMDWLIRKIDDDEDGIPHGHQWNTYDCAVSGANTFIGSQYLSALAAAERMAEIEGDAENAARYRKIREAGMKNQDKLLWNGEYYIQIPDDRPANDYNTGCHSDQILGQWWAHQLNLGYLYPPGRVKSVLSSIMRYNFREDFKGFRQRPRRFLLDSEGGLLMCTWPKGGRPRRFIIYADEVWTGIEYQAAASMIYEGMLKEGFTVVKTARDRYDGRIRPGLSSGPGGNPFNELECGKFYARAMSSWSLLLASQGFIHDGPKGILGFKPNFKPEDHCTFFNAAEGWGVFRQKRGGDAQTEKIEVRYGRLRLKELVFEVPNGVGEIKSSVRISGKDGVATLHRSGDEARLSFADEVIVPEGGAVEVRLEW